MNKINKNRNLGVDILKFLCAFLVVMIHAPIPGVSQYTTPIARIAVPIFFMITGYYYSNTVKSGKENKQIKKIAILFVVSNIIFIFWELIVDFVKDKSFVSFIEKMTSPETYLNFFVFNESPFSFHLWYVGAILYVLLIVKLLNKFDKIKILYYITPLLLLADIVFGKYSKVFFGCEFSYIYLRNFIFVGLPNFAIGLFISEHRESIKNFKFTKVLSIIAMVVFCATSDLEKYLLVSNKLNAPRDQYFSTTLLAMAVFIFFTIAVEFKSGKVSSILARLGQRYSLLIYIVHPIILTLCNQITPKIHLASVYKYTKPFVVFIGTVLVIFIYYLIKDAVQKKKQKKS